VAWEVMGNGVSVGGRRLRFCWAWPLLMWMGRNKCTIRALGSPADRFQEYNSQVKAHSALKKSSTLFGLF
jgi:hypothetical protein